MITKVTKDNHTQYTALFNDANKVLNINSTDANAIGSIEEYFQAFGNITTASNATKFVALPLDEPIFEINADTREIKVPSAFATYGLSVKGDQRAEIVYFSIDRYFDTTDLYDPITNTNSDGIHIIIQWEALQSGAVKARGVSKALFQDVEILKDQGKMLFGWAINNAITAYAGSIRFSVRFYSINTDKTVAFSLSTLTATAAIKDGLDFEISNGDFTTAIFDDTDAVRSRFQNSIITDETKKPASPIFFYDGVPILPTSDGFMIDNQWYVDLDANTDKYTLKTQAYSTDGGTGKMVYTWTLNGTPIDVNKTSNNVYLATEDETWDDNKLYYYKDVVSGVEKYELVTVDRTTVTLAEAQEAHDGALYERFGSCEADAVGTYIATAKNRQKKDAEPGEEGIYSADTESVAVIIPSPGDLTVTTAITDYDETNEQYQVRTVSQAGEEEVITHIATLNVTGDTTHAEWPTKDKINYIWGSDDENYEIETRSVDLVGGEPCTLNVDLSALTDAQLALYDHVFTVDVKASRNKVDTPAERKKFRVTAPARAFEVNRMQSQVRRTGGTAAIGVTLSNYDEILHDEVEFKWYHYTSDDVEGNDELIENFTISEDGKSCTAVVSEIGSYYCLVTNKVNGSIAVNPLDTTDPEQLITVS